VTARAGENLGAQGDLYRSPRGRVYRVWPSVYRVWPSAAEGFVQVWPWSVRLGRRRYNERGWVGTRAKIEEWTKIGTVEVEP
jgi:hypothetical protein